MDASSPSCIRRARRVSFLGQISCFLQDPLTKIVKTKKPAGRIDLLTATPSNRAGRPLPQKLPEIGQNENLFSVFVQRYLFFRHKLRFSSPHLSKALNLSCYAFIFFQFECQAFNKIQKSFFWIDSF